jgi:hypothetical protein
MLVERLLHGANILDFADPHTFDIASFQKCTIGLMARDPYFNKLGLVRLTWLPSEAVDRGYVDIIPTENKPFCERLAILFGVDVTVINYLFMPSGYEDLKHILHKPTPAIVAEKIREFVRTNGESFKAWHNERVTAWLESF